MSVKKTIDHDNAIHQMVEVVLSDIISSVLDEFETATGAHIGRVRIGHKDNITERRRIEVEILQADGESLTALMRYQKLLCEHEPLKNSRFCKSESN